MRLKMPPAHRPHLAEKNNMPTIVLQHLQQHPPPETASVAPPTARQTASQTACPLAPYRQSRKNAPAPAPALNPSISRKRRAVTSTPQAPSCMPASARQSIISAPRTVPQTAPSPAPQTARPLAPSRQSRKSLPPLC